MYALNICFSLEISSLHCHRRERLEFGTRWPNISKYKISVRFYHLTQLDRFCFSGVITEAFIISVLINEFWYTNFTSSWKLTISDMQKFPLRMKDNDLLVTELYKDPTLDQITAISVYLTPKTTSKYSSMYLTLRIW